MSQSIDISTQSNLVIENIGAATKTLAQLIADYPDATKGQEVISDSVLYKCKGASQWLILPNSANSGEVPIGQGLSRTGDGILYLGLGGKYPAANEVNLTSAPQDMVTAYPQRNLHWQAQTSFVFEVQCTDVNTSYQMVFYKSIDNAANEEIGTITRQVGVANQWDRITETFLIYEESRPTSTGKKYTVQMTAKRLLGAGTIKIRRFGLIEISN